MILGGTAAVIGLTVGALAILAIFRRVDAVQSNRHRVDDDGVAVEHAGLTGDVGGNGGHGDGQHPRNE